MNNENNFNSGTSGLVLPVSKDLYPPTFQGKSRLEYYASLFNSVEINSSFYKVPMSATLRKWAESVDDNFKFTFKLSKAITHAKGLQFNVEDVALFMQRIEHVGTKKGCLLVQFPPSIKIENINAVEQLLLTLKKAGANKSWKIAIEFRNPSWYHNEGYDLLHAYKTVLVLHDLPASATPILESKSEIMYLRFHGPGGRYRGSYTDDFLLQYAGYIKKWKKEGKSIYIYFNNTMGDAINNLQTLNQFLQS